MYYYKLAESGKRLKELRNKEGKVYTQEKVAEEVGISREYLNRLEAGKKGCSVDLLVIFAQYYDVTMDYITIQYERDSGEYYAVEDEPGYNLYYVDNAGNKHWFPYEVSREELELFSQNILPEIEHEIERETGRAR